MLARLTKPCPGENTTVFAKTFELAMQLKWVQLPGAGLHAHPPSRQGYASGFMPKRSDPPAATVSVQAPELPDTKRAIPPAVARAEAPQDRALSYSR